MPWVLAKGDIRANLVQLGALVKAPDDPAAAQLRALMQERYPMNELADAVALLRLVRWSTNPVEQYHASAATIRRLHPGLHLESLLLRSFCHQFWPLCNKPKIDLRVRALDTKISALARQCPQRLSGFRLLARNTTKVGLARRSTRRCAAADVRACFASLAWLGQECAGVLYESCESGAARASEGPRLALG